MSATINSAPSPATTVAQIAMQGAADTATAAADAGTADSGVGSFGALFQQLLGKQPVVAADPVMPVSLALSADATSAAEVNPAGTLAALMPFLEGMGLIKTDTPGDDRDLKDPAAPDTDDVDPAALAGIAPALTPQLVAAAAITAAQTTAGNSSPAPALILPDAPSSLQAQTQTAVLATVENAGGLAADISSKFSAALEAAADKATGTATTTNPAGQISQPIGSPLATNQTSPVPTLPIDQHVGASGWGQEVGNRLVWMSSSSTNSHAELVLTPPQMGRIEVSLSVTGDQATATFVSTNPAVREALETAMPRLREILADAGIQLGQTQVGAENAHQSAQQEKNGDNFAFGRNVPPDAGASQTIATAPQPASSGLKSGRGLVDVFA